MAQVELEQKARKALELIETIRGAKPHLNIWQRLATGQFMEALELSSQKWGARTPSGLVHQLVEHYARTPKKHSVRRAKQAAEIILEMIEDAEGGLNLRLELSALAHELELGPLNLDQMKVTRSIKSAVNKANFAAKRAAERAAAKAKREEEQGTVTGDEHGAVTGDGSCATTRAPSPLPHAREALPAVILAPARDPYARHSALKERAQMVQRLVPPPERIPNIHTASAADRADWLSWLDQVQRRWPAPLTDLDLCMMADLTRGQAQFWLTEWRRLLEKGLTEDQRRSMAMSMSAEAEAIAREALALVQSSEDDRIKATGLKLALDSLARRQSLAGLDRITLEHQTTTQAVSWTEQAKEAGLSAEDLSQIGDIASRAMSRKSLDEEK